MLPGISGFAVLERLRVRKKTPVLMLTARTRTTDRVRGLDGGADDYLAKPYELPELLARIRALIRRAANAATTAVKIGDVTVDLAGHTVRQRGEPVALTAREISLIEYLAQHRGRVLTRERDTATYQQTLEACVNAARRLQQLTESLLELATHDAGAVALNLEPCDLAMIARETAALVQPLADERRIALAPDLAPAPCRADAKRIAQVILNLLSNALEHSPEGSRIAMRTAAESGRATFSIEDSGPGIAEEHLPRIFDRFYRADDSRNRRTGGAGLGLAICKAIAEAHGGALEVSSTLGKGSVFTLVIPAAQDAVA